jgi:hypothetical protein
LPENLYAAASYLEQLPLLLQQDEDVLDTGLWHELQAPKASETTARAMTGRKRRTNFMILG